MKLELKKIKIHPDMSEETNCFSADLWVDGKMVGQVRNEGRGGSHRYDIPYPVQDKLHAWAKTQPRKYPDLDIDLDQIIDTLLDEAETRQFLTRNTKKKTVFKLEDNKKGEWQILNMPYNADTDAYVVAKYGAKLRLIANRDLDAAVASEK